MKSLNPSVGLNGVPVGGSIVVNLAMTRNVAFPGFFEKESGVAAYSTAQVFGDFSYRYGVGPARIEPFDTVAYVAVNGAPFSETGGSAALHAVSNDTNITYNTAGARGAYSFNLGALVSTLEGSVGWRHAFGDLTPQQAFNFAGGSVFTVAGVPIAADALAVKSNVNFALTRSLLLAARYEGQFAKTSTDQSVRGAMSYNF